MQKGEQAQEILGELGLGSRKSGEGGKTNKRIGYLPWSVAGAAPLVELPLFHPLFLSALWVNYWHLPVPVKVDPPSCTAGLFWPNTITPPALLPVQTGLPCTVPAPSLGTCFVLNSRLEKSAGWSALPLQRACWETEGKSSWIEHQNSEDKDKSASFSHTERIHCPSSPCSS